MQAMLRSARAPSSWMNIQQSPHCFDSLNKKERHAKCHKSLNSQYRCLYRCLYTDRCCLSFIHLRPSHNFPFLNNQTCCLDTFMTKARFYHFFLHQTQRKHDGNVREKVWRTLFTLRPVLDVPVRWRRYESTCFLRYVMGLSFAVIGSGVHVTVVAPVDNACAIFKAFMK